MKNKTLWPHTGAIFCGGKSSRMGTPKAGIVLSSGKTMIEHVYLVLKELCPKVVLVGHAQAVPTSMSALTKIEDNYKDCGPIGGLEALLSSKIDSEYLIVACDMPNISIDLLKLLIDVRSVSSAVIISIKDKNEFVEPMIGRYSVEILPKVKEAIKRKEFSLQRLVEKINAEKILIPNKLIGSLNNINSAEDLINRN